LIISAKRLLQHNLEGLAAVILAANSTILRTASARDGNVDLIAAAFMTKKQDTDS
jgi:hypothetical protein